MPNALIFGEDYAHEVVLRTLLERLAADLAVPVVIQVRSTTGGHGRMLRELEELVGELRRGRDSLPDLLIAARDANCLGYAARVKEVTTKLQGYKGLLVCAVPDPHIERWLLIDSHAFKQVLGHGCNAPDQKCNRDRYKQRLDEAVRAAGIKPLLGGIEFAEDIIQAMDLDRSARADTSFGHLLRDLRNTFQRWITP